MNFPFQTEWLRRFYGRNSGKIWVVQTFILLLIGFSIAWSMKSPASKPDLAKSVAPHADHSKINQIWTCAMHPQIRRNASGKCPICGMELYKSDEIVEDLDDILTDSINPVIIIGSTRTPRQDVGYAALELVEIAVRALSPGIKPS